MRTKLFDRKAVHIRGGLYCIWFPKSIQWYIWSKPAILRSIMKIHANLKTLGDHDLTFKG